MTEPPSISIIGPGRVGQTLGRALHEHGCRIVDVIGRDEGRLRQAVTFIGDGNGKLSLSDISDEGRVIFITVGDDDIGPVATALSRIETSLAGRSVFHFSGSYSSEILQPLADRGMHTGSMHPLMSFADPATAVKKLPGVSYCLEGQREAVAVGRQLVSYLKGSHFSIETASKPLYHAAAVLACGQMIALLDVAFSVWRSIGIDEETTRKALMPLIKSGVEGAEQMGPEKAMTGPFSRGDTGTIEKHVNELQRTHPHFADMYRILGEHALTLSKIDDNRKETIREILRRPRT